MLNHQVTGKEFDTLHKSSLSFVHRNYCLDCTESVSGYYKNENNYILNLKSSLVFSILPRCNDTVENLVTYVTKWCLNDSTRG